MADNTQNLVDSLGNVLTVGVGDIDSALKALAQALRQDVMPAKGSNNPVVQKLDELIGNGNATFKKFLEDNFVKKLHDKFKPEMDDLTQEVKECKDALKVIAGKSGSGTKSSSGCECQDLLNAIKGSIDTVNTTLTSTGVKLESAAVDLLKKIKSGINKLVTGNVVRGGSGRGGGSASAVSSATSVGGGMPGGSMPGGNIYNTVMDVAMGLNDTMEEANKVMQSSNRYARSLAYNVGELDYSIGTMLDNMSSNIDENLPESIAMVKKANREWKSLLNIVNALSHEDLDPLHKHKLLEAVKALDQALKHGKNITEEHQKLLKVVSEISWHYRKIAAINAVGGMLIGNFAKQSHKILGGLIVDLNEWEQETTRMAATMTGATHDAGGESKKLVAQYRNLLRVENDIVRVTHQFPAVIRKQWLVAIKKGTRNLEETRDVVTSAMAGAWQIGANAEAAADEFQKWNMHVGMSAKGATALARTMTVVSKTTGVMGDNMLQAVSAAREIAQLMRDTGVYSQDVANSVVGWMASAQKFGIDRQMQNIFRASQGGLEAFTQASSETRNLLASSGQLQNVLRGEADPDKVMSGIGAAIRNAIPAGAFAGKNKMVGLPDLKKLSKAEISRLDIIMKRRFGMKLGEATRLLESIQDQNPSEKLAQIERDLKNPTLTKAEQEALELQKKQLEIAKDEKSLGKLLDGFSEMAEMGKMQGADLEKMLTAGRFKDISAFSNAVSESTRLLSQKMERQGKSFKDAMGMTEDTFKQQINSTIEGIRNGNVDSVRQFRELQSKMDEANKMADSSAKNNSNTLDKQETQQQVIQNTIQNMSKDIHTVVSQLPLALFNLVTIAGGVWALYRLWTGGRISENIKGTFDTLVRTIGTKGSGWVHDPYVEHFVKNIDRNLVGLGKHLTKGRFGGTRATALHDSTSSQVQGMGGVLDTVTAKFGVLSGTLDSVKSSFLGWWDTLRGYLPGGMGGAIGGGKKIVQGPEVVAKAPPLRTQMKGSDAIMSGAGKIAAIAAGVVLMGVTLVAAAKAIMNMSGFDAKQAKEVATVLTVVIGAGAGTLLAAAAVSKVIELANKSLNMRSIGQIYKGGFMLALLLPAIALLGLAVVGIGALMSYAIEPKKAEEYANATAGILWSAAKIALAITLAAASLLVLGLLALKAKFLLPVLGAGALALLILTPAMLLLAGAVIGMAALAQKYVDPKWAEETSKATAGIMMAAGIIAGSVVLSVASLIALSALVPIYPWVAGLMASGTLALLALTPAMVGVAWAVIKMAEQVNSLVNIEWAQKTSKATADIMLSAAKIAGAVVGAVAFLQILGAFTSVAWAMVPVITLGAGALLALTPAMIKMAEAIINIASNFVKSVDIEEGSKVASATASFLESAFKIAKSIVEAQAYLSALGAMSSLSMVIAPYLYAGAKGLNSMAGSIFDFAMSTIMIGKSLQGGSAADMKKVLEILTYLPQFITGLSLRMVALSQSKALNKDLNTKVLDFAHWFYDVGDGLANGVIAPIINGGFLDVNQINQATDNLSVIVEALGNLASVMGDLGTLLDQMSTNNLDFSGLNSASFKAGKFNFSVGTSGSGSETKDWMDKILGVFTGVGAPQMTMAGGLLRGMRGTFSKAIENPMNSVSDATSKVETGVTRLGTDFGDIGSRIDIMKLTLHDDLVNIGAVIESKFMPQTASEEARPTVSQGDFDAQVRARVEQNRPSASMQAATDYLVEIAANTSATVEELERVVDILEGIRNNMNSAVGSTVASSKSVKPRGNPNYFGWNYGRFGDTSAKQYVNSGDNA